jgi:hypothetical protein
MVAQRLNDFEVLTEHIQTRLDISTYNKVLAEAKRQRISKTALARDAIRQYLKTTKPSAA